MSQVLLRRAVASTTWLGALFLLNSCVSLAPIRERDHAHVTARAVQKAASSSDDRVRTGLEDLLAVRMAEPHRVSADLAAEAVVSLGRIGRPESFPVLSRVLTDERDDEVRFLAVEATLRVDIDRARVACEAAVHADPSELVRTQAQEALRRRPPGP